MVHLSSFCPLSHLFDTDDPHGSTMRVTAKILTPEVHNDGGNFIVRSSGQIRLRPSGEVNGLNIRKFGSEITIATDTSDRIRMSTTGDMFLSGSGVSQMGSLASAAIWSGSAHTFQARPSLNEILTLTDTADPAEDHLNITNGNGQAVISVGALSQSDNVSIVVQPKGAGVFSVAANTNLNGNDLSNVGTIDGVDPADWMLSLSDDPSPTLAGALNASNNALTNVTTINGTNPASWLTALVDDTTPQLFADLDCQVNSLTNCHQLTGSSDNGTPATIFNLVRSTVYSNTAWHRGGLAFLRYEGSESSPTGVTAGTDIGSLLFRGARSDGTTTRRAIEVIVEVQSDFDSLGGQATWALRGDTDGGIDNYPIQVWNTNHVVIAGNAGVTPEESLDVLGTMLCKDRARFTNSIVLESSTTGWITLPHLESGADVPSKHTVNFYMEEDGGGVPRIKVRDNSGTVRELQYV